MSDKKQYPSDVVPKERRLQCYTSPHYTGLTKAYAKVNEMTESKVVNLALKCFFDKMPDSEKQKIITTSKNHY